MHFLTVFDEESTTASGEETRDGGKDGERGTRITRG